MLIGSAIINSIIIDSVLFKINAITINVIVTSIVHPDLYKSEPKTVGNYNIIIILAMQMYNEFMQFI